jgi:anti-sigma-K factor RskA
VTEFHAEVGAYALDALDESERAAFERHLAGCASCQRELAEFTETAVRLGALADEAPPAELRASVLDAIRAVRPLAPEDDPSLTAPPAPGPRRAVTPSWEPVPAGEPGETGRPRRSFDLASSDATDELAARRLRRRSRLLTLAVAAATVIALALGGWTYTLHREQQVVAAQAAAATRLLSAPDVRTYPLTVDGAPATFVVSKSLDEAMFVGSNVPEAPSGRTYQLWTLDADQHPTPDARFAGGPNTRTFMDGDIRSAAYLAVSDEPEGGSTTPTTTPVVVQL